MKPQSDVEKEGIKTNLLGKVEMLTTVPFTVQIIESFQPMLSDNLHVQHFYSQLNSAFS